MPISDNPNPQIIRLQVSVTEASSNAVVGFDVPLPIPPGIIMGDGAIRSFYQKFVNALENSDEFSEVTGKLVTEQLATVTPDE